MLALGSVRTFGLLDRLSEGTARAMSSARKPPVPSSPRIIWPHFGEKGPLVAETRKRSTVRPERRDCSHLRKPRDPRESKESEDGVGGGHETEGGGGDDRAGS